MEKALSEKKKFSKSMSPMQKTQLFIEKNMQTKNILAST